MIVTESDYDIAVEKLNKLLDIEQHRELTEEELARLEEIGDAIEYYDETVLKILED